ncbi:uncharacterized protein FSUBG_13734 [Fusarium subglutinans]|uniref:Uncharacterized protein n=1 Tax=Gibberella subglutinans TaxID=42677 RepID=A0A8H5KUG2_GIBSU|nr:uncharacterized protein FSUBG_13734 [Fusarium subglutinans]KAF5578716.1 hypothetical protein FSUBG_13734 [Fusarium subglutinans]
MNHLSAVLKECEPVNTEIARMTWKCLQGTHGQSWVSLISSLRGFQASAFKDPENSPLGNHLGNIFQCLHGELGIPPTPGQAHQETELDVEMIDTKNAEGTQRKALQTVIGSLETVLGRISKNI